MFIQVIQGTVPDPPQQRRQLDKWVAELAPGATGWLGSTAGVTDDGQAIALVRFESEEAARHNSDRSEQSLWWEEMARLYDGEPSFHDSTAVEVNLQDDPARAGFVQVMQGRSSDVQRVRQLMSDDPTDWSTFRPDLLGSLWLAHEDDGWTMAIYFTSEAAAREGEQKEPPADLQERMQELETLAIGDTTYLDLRDPWLHAPD